MKIHVDQQWHGYKNGHQLLGGSAKLVRDDQDLVDRLSDISGALTPGEVFAPYLTAYPLPSRTFYVLARTWQDLDAPRAGCVLTRSLLIPMREWGAIDSLAPLLEELIPFDRDHVDAGGRNIETRPASIPPVTSSSVTDIIEAMFLEDRQPTVVFDESQSELIFHRLLLAFWPSLRQGFSSCTFALSPRTIKGKPFDLVFAPKTARSQYSRWDGRTIDSHSTRPREGRHRWTMNIAKRVFDDPVPTLMSLDALGVLRLDDSGDESNIRLALLWNELFDKAEQSPTAVLGLLDILRARRVDMATNSELLVPLISRSVNLAQNTMPASEMISFLLTLVGKFPAQPLPFKLLSKLRRAVANVTSTKPELVLALLRSESKPKSAETPIVSAGFGDGFAAVTRIELHDILEIPEHELLRLLAHSSDFARYLIGATSKAPQSLWMKPLIDCLEYPDSDLLKKARRRIIPVLTVGQQAPILNACVRGISVSSLVAVVHAIGGTTSFSVAEFDEPLCNAAKGQPGLLWVRSAILDGPETVGSDRFLASTIRAYPLDIWWILNEEKITYRRRREVLKHALANATEEDIRALAYDSKAVRRVDELIEDEVSSCARAFARLLQLSNLPTDFFLDRSARLLPFLEHEHQRELIDTALTRGFASGSSSANSVLNRLLDSYGDQLNYQNLVAIAVPSHASADRASDNVVMLNEANAVIRRGVLSHIGDLSDRLIRKYGANLSPAAIRAWAALLSDSRSENQAAQLMAASSTLSFALSNLHAPVSPLVVSAFPIVDAELKTEREAPSLLFFFFTDWDRCKTARKDLIRAFFNSDWPPSDLILAVMPTGDLTIVLRMILNEREGECFLSRLRGDMNNLVPEKQRMIERVLSSAWNEVQRH